MEDSKTRKLQLIVLTPPGQLDPSMAIAASRAGGIGVLDLEYARDRGAALDAIQELSRSAPGDCGIKLNGHAEDFLTEIVSKLPPRLRVVILAPPPPRRLKEQVELLHRKNLTVLLEATNLDEARSGEGAGVDGLIAKGHEAGGRVGEETTFILLQEFSSQLSLPFWAHGGVGLHTAAACFAAGAAGVVLDAQLALTRPSSLSEAVKARIAHMDGSETAVLGGRLGAAYRVYDRPGCRGVEELRRIEASLAEDERPRSDVEASWREAVLQRVGWDSPEENVLLLGQDAAFAGPLARRFSTLGRVVEAIRQETSAHCTVASRLHPLDEGSSLARSHGTRYPIVQGPMTRVSDTAEFAARVAEGGALPFLALALMRGPKVKNLLKETRARLGEYPWGVGILGFVPAELRQEQLEAIRAYHPPFALIAGGRPDQARALEKDGIPTYLHVPSPGLLQMFLQSGARRFVFEGRECGGHVGPRSSFVLWNQMIDALLDFLASDASEGSPEDYHVLFAGGIHDALSAAMVAVMTAPLAERGARVGVLLGTAYLFTEEAVTSKTIQKGFQEEAIRCERTVLLESGPGHATRCVDTPYAALFEREKQRLSSSGLSADEVRLALEKLNLGRLRMASKGLARNSEADQDPGAPEFKHFSDDEQRTEGMYMIGQLAALRNQVCSIEALHSNVAVQGSKRLDALNESASSSVPAAQTERVSDIAIIGMACLLPKAPDLQTYWENILNKVDAITEVPADRWDWHRYYDQDPKARDKVYSKWGGFIEDIPFDPMRYGIPPTVLPSVETNQLLTLEVVQAALKDAGYADRPFPRERTSVILGAGGGAADLGLAYSARSFLPVIDKVPGLPVTSQDILSGLQDVLPEWTEDSFAGILTNVVAGRVANRFDLGGSNYTVDAACASSLAAVSQAVKELQSLSSDMVIVGGVDTMQSPFLYLCFSKTHALSPRGRCRTFDESADGIVISEGIAILILKRLADAERDGDRIYAVIKGVGSSSDGRDKGLTAPRPEGQARALRRAYAEANVSPATVGLVEAHGTGTVVGDQAEVQSLALVFDEADARRQSCAIGSVKSMIGHTKCTAGAAGLIKVALALHHRVLPPTLGVDTPNPRARFPETPFYVNSESRPWLNGMNGAPRRAGVSAFGFGGTNFHVVVEEYNGHPISSTLQASQRWPSELFLWSGRSRRDLIEAIERIEKLLARSVEPALADLSYALWNEIGERTPELRLAVVAASAEDLKQKLRWAHEALSTSGKPTIHDPRGIYFSEQPLAKTGKVAFLFPGQGSHYVNMMRDLAIHFREVRDCFERADRILSRRLVQPLSSYVFPPPSFSTEEERGRQRDLTQTNVAQPALGAADMAMFGLLETLGVRPDFVAGHSYGELVALAAAGVFSDEVLFELSEARGRFILQAAHPEPGIMAAVDAESELVSEILSSLDGVNLANLNAPNQTVISGTRAAVESAVERLMSRDLRARILPVACAFHSPIVAPAQERLAEFLASVELAEPRVPVYSNSSAAPYPTDPESIARQLVEQLVRPVEFVREIEALHDAGARIFVEVGPRNVLTGLAEQILGDRPRLAVASDQGGRAGLSQLHHLLGQLAAQGVPVQLDPLYERRALKGSNLVELEEEDSRAALSATTWMVNGGKAKPREGSQPRQPRTGAPPASPINGRGLAASVALAPEIAAGSMNPPVDGASKSASAPASTEVSGDDGTARVMAQFQQMMTRFLDTQNNVMLAYLQGTAGAVADELTSEKMEEVHPTTVPSPHPPSSDADGMTANIPEQAPPEMPATVSEEVSELSDRDGLTSRLLAIVSERTGYPAEMLSLDQDLEADLGIDSIKRVEILGNFQQSFASGNETNTEELMEKLSEVRTLGGIIEWVTDRVMPQAESRQPATAEERASRAAAQSQEDNGQGDREVQRYVLTPVDTP